MSSGFVPALLRRFNYFQLESCRVACAFACHSRAILHVCCTLTAHLVHKSHPPRRAWSNSATTATYTPADTVTFIVEQNQKWLIVVGDAKTYDIVRSIRTEYGEYMQWLIPWPGDWHILLNYQKALMKAYADAGLPWPGDWHILLNYQKALMKAYADAGLTTLAEATKDRSETLTSLVQCTNFRRTHNFLTHAMEKFYRFFLSVVLKETNPGQLLEEIENVVADFAALSDDTDLTSFRDKVYSLRSSAMLAVFVSYSQKLCQKQDTLKF